VALAVDAQRSGTGQPSATTVANVQRSVGLPANGVLDAATRNRLADLLDEPSSQTALPPRDAAHRAARSLCAMALRNPARLMPAIPPDDSIRPGQLALGVPTTGRLDQTTMARALTELARDQ
jgi:hypothetical protein